MRKCLYALFIIGLFACWEPLSAQEKQGAAQDPQAQQQATTAARLQDIKTIFVEPMANDLDQYIRAEISKQLRDRLTVTLKKEDADATLIGTGDWKKGTGSAITGRLLGLHDTATGAISLVSKDSTTVLWASEAGDRSIWWGVMKRGGPRKVADRLVHNLKKALEQSK